MSDKMRWRYGDVHPVVAAVDADVTIEMGDLLYQEVDDARPAATQAEQGSEWRNQEKFAQRFLGVAMQRSRSGESAPIRVATTGVFEFDCPEGTFELGDMVGAAPGADGKGLCSQKVVKLSSYEDATLGFHEFRKIGRVAQREPVAVQTVLVAVSSRVMSV